MATETIPTFRYFHDPFYAGVVERSDETCPCCLKPHGYVCTTQIYAVADAENICPWCVAEGSAAHKRDGTFNILSGGLSLPSDIRDCVNHRTPALETWQDWSWPSSDTDAQCFIGEVDGKAILREGDEKKIAACLAAFDGWGGDPFTRDDLKYIVPSGDSAIYLFEDLETGAITAIADMS